MSKASEKQSVPDEKKTIVDNNLQKTKTKGKTSQEMMHKHIHDEQDVISDEDFKNLQLDLELPTDQAHQPLVIDNDPDRPKDEDKDPVVIVPWDLIK